MQIQIKYLLPLAVYKINCRQNEFPFSVGMMPSSLLNQGLVTTQDGYHAYDIDIDS